LRPRRKQQRVARLERRAFEQHLAGQPVVLVGFRLDERAVALEPVFERERDDEEPVEQHRVPEQQQVTA